MKTENYFKFIDNSSSYFNLNDNRVQPIKRAGGDITLRMLNCLFCSNERQKA